MLKHILPKLLIIVLLASCKKSDTTTPNGPGTVSTDPAKYILLSKKEVNPATSKEMLTLTCYNPDMSVRWKKTELGTSYSGGGVAPVLNFTPGVAYENNVAYFSADSVFSVGSTYYLYNLFFAFDINTGNVIWKRRSTNDYLQSPIVRNDTIFCNYQDNSMANYVAAFDAHNGTELWRKSIAEKWGAEYLVLDGKMLYYASTQSNYVALVTAFDLSSKTIKWQTSIGANGSSGYSKLALDGDLVYIRNGAGSLLAINKNTGTTVWSKAGFSVPQCANNKVYSLKSDYMIYGLDASGTEQMHCTPNLGFGTRPFVSGGTMYITGVTPATPTSTNFVASYNAQTGAENWRKNLSVYYEGPVAAGNKIYAFHREQPGSSFVYTIMSFDTNSGAVKDSIVTTGTGIGNIEIINTSGKKLSPAF